MDIGIIKKNFDRIRAAKGLKIEEICTNMGGITRQQLYNYMKTGTTVASLAKISAALGVRAADLLNEDENPPIIQGIFCPHCGKFIHLTTTPENGKSK